MAETAERGYIAQRRTETSRAWNWQPKCEALSYSFTTSELNTHGMPTRNTAPKMISGRG